MAKRPRLGEFELIARHFAPLASGRPGALGLLDDAALLAPPPGETLVLTADTIVGGVHFRADDPPALVARKLLRVNLSDLAAMAARPVAYLLALSLAAECDDDWIAAFAAGLAADQAEFGIELLGGDTTATPGPLSATITAIGALPKGTELLRSGARPGDVVHVSGTLGDAALGLMALDGKLGELGEDAAARLIERYRLPRPRIALGQALRGIATAAADVSDGLVADLGHICAASGVAARVDHARLPLDPAARFAVARHGEAASAILSGGDDYELVFTAPPEASAAVTDAAARSDVAVTEIGRIEHGGIQDGGGVKVVAEDGREIALTLTGYRHF